MKGTIRYTIFARDLAEISEVSPNEYRGALEDWLQLHWPSLDIRVRVDQTGSHGEVLESCDVSRDKVNQLAAEVLARVEARWRQTPGRSRKRR